MIINIKHISLIFLVLALSSCADDFLDTKPTDAISAADALTSEENMALVISGMHRTMYSQSQTVLPGGSTIATTARANEHFWVPLGDNLAGGVIHSARANNLGWQNQTQWISHTIPESNTTRVLWYHRYNMIANANTIINKFAEGTLADTEDLRSIVGQAYAYRAYAYMSLVQHYAKGYLIGNPCR